ncbi:MAG: hypothetical protein IT353_04855 [Gemmatimonadaceae bacterium]|nr:hypothetical protein [Gemmatimonadaceae bacterium]
MKWPRIEKAFGVNMDTLLRMQLAYDIALTRQNEKKIKVKRYVGDHVEAGVGESSHTTSESFAGVDVAIARAPNPAML